MDKLITAAHTALDSCMALKSNESILIVTDDNKQKIGSALYKVGREMAKEALMVVMPPAQVNGEEPPEKIAKLMMAYDVVVCPTTKSITHTDAKRNACTAGARVATMPGISEDIMVRTLKADYDIIAQRTIRLSQILSSGKRAHITTALGTDLDMPIAGIQAISSTGLVREKGQGGNLPSGESFLMPEEGKTNGVVYVDASVATIGKISQQFLKVTIKDGYAVKFEGGPEAKKLEQALGAFGKDGMNVAELGIGTNHEATITGQILEDEKVMGTIHVAWGNNVSMGGSFNVGVHIDGVVLKPTVFVDDQKIMQDGVLLID